MQVNQQVDANVGCTEGVLFVLNRAAITPSLYKSQRVYNLYLHIAYT